MAYQVPLFGRQEPRFDASFARLERIQLGGEAWLDVARGWLDGHAALFERLRVEVAWREESRRMYDRVVDVPRLFAVLSPRERPPVVEAMRRALSARYATDFERVSVAQYRSCQRTHQHAIPKAAHAGPRIAIMFRPTWAE